MLYVLFIFISDLVKIKMIFSSRILYYCVIFYASDLSYFVTVFLRFISSYFRFSWNKNIIFLITSFTLSRVILSQQVKYFVSVFCVPFLCNLGLVETKYVYYFRHVLRIIVGEKIPLIAFVCLSVHFCKWGTILYVKIVVFHFPLLNGLIDSVSVEM